MDGHLLDRLFAAAQEEVLAAGQGAGLVGLDGDEGREVAVVGLGLLALGGGPHGLVAVGGHLVEDFHLALHDHAVGLTAHELQIGTGAEDGVAVHGAVAVVPVEAALQDRLPQLFHLLGVARDGLLTEQGAVDHPGQQFIAVVREVHAVDCQGRRG